MFDGEAFGQAIVDVVKGYVDGELTALREENATLRDRIAAIEADEPPPVPEIDMDAIRRAAELAAGQTIGAHLAEYERRFELRVGEIGPELARATGEQIAAAMAELPKPEKGEPGQDVDPAEVARLVADEVAKAVAALPPAERGKDGVGLADALVDHEGRLVVTFSNGETKTLARVVGKDGDPGKDAPPPFTLDDFDIEPIDERTIKMSFTHSGVKHAFELVIPAVIYRGVWREGETYQRGDLVTWGGSMWHCDKDGTLAKPDGGDYTLAVKRGRDGKDATRGT